MPNDAKLEIYGKEHTCPKCHDETPAVSIYQDGETFNCWYFHRHPRSEHFDRRCENCGYLWAEAVA